jgi:UDP-N-acetylmuramoyl-L-alanyl-D-glutamate--2,6-diaminopimelate ligase
MMGEVAARLSDVVILTSDNPRTEDPAAILRDIEAGITRAELTALAPERLCDGRRGYVVEKDRRRALALSLEIGRPGDIVVVAGKGHEDYQIVGTERRPFDDRAEIRALLRARHGGGAS